MLRCPPRSSQPMLLDTSSVVVSLFSPSQITWSGASLAWSLGVCSSSWGHCGQVRGYEVLTLLHDGNMDRELS